MYVGNYEMSSYMLQLLHVCNVQASLLGKMLTISNVDPDFQVYY